ncbi:hypothetical protein LOZ12_005754 [Ophidiomyces ophidiicola]|uniref:Uncharacterized protein n=1 Tax=Ophidiomyces ophidiicola TaxID=1387563 RepID=A0ACB8UTM7_9EURO|nr:uncharacterized protein LOZ57_004642 [Ophidiomyces ophidiicola]KAI1906867.1 hypothetical protein LOZ61_006464 [Ophidiomyces ophidiicola]KAI1909036.1 hypothetical protein LOZ64_005347 [Ophidiomyces ophidiicola]KAI1926664.1 hypothetical protein LOZ60_003479 [Ophidiomyces ophidiicola]KAI1944629.1 hypothetical protein LOZ57_004642 [Ophidiomyces ophidiicola]KAI1953258.1 hypothetical protein LOZ62_001099 [Ophidiomyces ophidiicola]
MASSPPPSPPSSKAPTVIVSPPTAATTPVGVKQKQPPADDTAASTPPDDDPIPIHRAKRAIESTAAYNFLRQFRRHVSPSGHHPTSAPPPQADQNSTSKTNSSSPSDVLSNSSSPTLTASSADGNHPSSHRDDASSLPSLSSSPETVSGTPEMNPCAVSVAKLKNGANNDINSPRFHV